jgi:hypothetical protein
MKQLADLALQVMDEFTELSKVNNFSSDLEFQHDAFYVAVRVLRNSHLFFEYNPYTWEDTRLLQDTLDILEYGPVPKAHYEVFTKILNRDATP